MRTHRLSRGRVLMVVPLLLLCAGCIRRTVKGDVATFRFEWWVIAGVALGGIAAAIVGWLVRKRVARLGWPLVIVGPLATLFIAPTMWFDRVVVDSNHFETRRGMPGGRQDNVRFDDVQAIRSYSRYERAGRSHETHSYLDFTHKDGQVETVPIGDLLQGAVGEILERSARKGIAVTEQGEEPEMGNGDEPN